MHRNDGMETESKKYTEILKLIDRIGVTRSFPTNVYLFRIPVLIKMFNRINKAEFSLATWSRWYSNHDLIGFSC